ncbi:Com family DNA-binding transcriptional regulator [Variovorax paradoxus]|uniref:Com family DNA-binding transcriptional regulator n=1 Tax=Variovorax paradoxus TaxID=34073 RepID=UPI0022A832EE|nr:Com family DNA-binding transcriptional regulator [Variovorax paradoxus]
MHEVRCGQCGRKLAMADAGRIEIKCPRCGTMNHWRASAADRSSPSPKPERQRASSTIEDRDDATEKPAGVAGWQEPPGGPDHRADARSPDLLRGVRRRGLGAL